MKYKITHTTQYQYSQAVSVCHSEARLLPRSFNGQQCLSSKLEITPQAANLQERLDFFGNRIVFFELQQAHEQLTVTAHSEVDVADSSKQISMPLQDSWENLATRLHDPLNPATSNVDDFLQLHLLSLHSEMIPNLPEIRDYAAASFQTGWSVINVAEDLTRRIYQDFSYDPSFTTITTPLARVFAHKRGVCQDFAHLAIACLRSVGLPARYVSGYIETTPPPGQIKLAGSDASHAWFSVFQPEQGWQDFDPTNNCATGEQHITLAWGRDYHDIAPFKGLARGGNQHQVSVAVDVRRT